MLFFVCSFAKNHDYICSTRTFGKIFLDTHFCQRHLQKRSVDVNRHLKDLEYTIGYGEGAPEDVMGFHAIDGGALTHTEVKRPLRCIGSVTMMAICF